MKSHRLVFVFLYDLKCSCTEKINNIFLNLGFCSFELVPSLGRARGLLLMWKKEFNMKVIVSSNSYINCLVFSKLFPEPWLLTCIYGSPIPSRRSLFWDSLDSIGTSHMGSWLVIGDFNTVLSSVDKLGGKAVASSSHGGLRKIMDDHGLIDLGFEGHPYTWNNRRGGLANIQNGWIGA